MNIRTHTCFVLLLAVLADTAAAQEPAGGSPAKPKLTSLKAVMPSYGVSAHRIQTALWREDYPTVAREALSIVQHARLPKEEQPRIAEALRQDVAWFQEADAKVYRSALAIAQAAEEKNAVKIVKALGAMQEGCAGCHLNYRERLRTK